MDARAISNQSNLNAGGTFSRESLIKVANTSSREKEDALETFEHV